MKTETEIVLAEIKTKRLELFKLREQLKTLKDEEINNLLAPFLGEYYLEVRDEYIYKYMYIYKLKDNQLLCLSILVTNDQYTNLTIDDEFNYYIIHNQLDTLKEITSNDFNNILDNFYVTIKNIIK